jgi:hypothetical protein
VDRTILDMPISTYGAAGREQWGVAISRAKHEVTVFTDAVEQLREAILISEARSSAHDIGAHKEREGQKEEPAKEAAQRPFRQRPYRSSDDYQPNRQSNPSRTPERGEDLV